MKLYYCRDKAATGPHQLPHYFSHTKHIQSIPAIFTNLFFKILCHYNGYFYSLFEFSCFGFSPRSAPSYDKKRLPGCVSVQTPLTHERFFTPTLSCNSQDVAVYSYSPVYPRIFASYAKHSPRAQYFPPTVWCVLSRLAESFMPEVDCT